jgi:hypothetical protein
MSDYAAYNWYLTKIFFKLVFSFVLAIFVTFALARLSKLCLFGVAFFAAIFVIKHLEHAFGNYDETQWIATNVCGIPADQWCHDKALSILRRDNIIITNTNQSVQNSDLFNLLQETTALRLEQEKL